MKVSVDWDAVKSCSLVDFECFLNEKNVTTSFAASFIGNASEVSLNLDLLGKLVIVLRDKWLDDESLKKISEVFQNCIDSTNKTIRTEHVSKLFESEERQQSIEGEVAFACNFCDIDFIKKIASSKNINSCNDQGETPLMVASFHGRPKIAEFLIESGADVNYITHLGVSAFHYACISGNTEVIQLLLTKENINLRCGRGYPPLRYACFVKHLEGVKFLIQSGADKNACDFEGSSPLHIACHWGYNDIAALLITQENINAPNNKNLTPLMIACSNNKPEIVRLLIEKGAKADWVNQDGQSAFHCACISGCKEGVELLLTKDNINASFACVTPLMLACASNQLEIFKFLIEKGADKSALGEGRAKALHIACNYGAKEIVEDLITEENLNVPNDEGFTPLMIACLHNFPEIVKLLIERNADIDAINKQGINALGYACDSGNPEVLAQLINKDNINKPIVGFTPLEIARLGRNIKNMEFLLKEGAFLKDLSKQSVLFDWEKMIYISSFLEIKDAIVDIDSIVESIYEDCDIENDVLNESIMLYHCNDIDSLEKEIKAGEELLRDFSDVMRFMNYCDQLSLENKNFRSNNRQVATKLRKKLGEALVKERKRLQDLKFSPREKLENDFKGKDIHQILFEWGIGGQPKLENNMGLEDALDKPYKDFLGIESREYLTTMEIEIGQDLIDKVGISIDLEILLSTVSDKDELRKQLQESVKQKMNKYPFICHEKIKNLHQRLEKEELSEEFLKEVRQEEIRINIASLRYYLTKDFSFNEAKKQRL